MSGLLFSDVSPGQASWLGRWPAGLKLLVLLVMASAFVLVTNPVVLGASALVTVWLWRSVAGPVNWGAWRQGIWILVTIGVVVAYVALFSGMSQALVVLFRLLALLFAALAVVASTSTTAMMQAVQTALTPLAKLGWVNPAKVALAFGLTLRLVPVMLQQWQEIREAQAARGVKAAPHALLIPMLARTIRRADELAEAIDARADGADFR
jgi:biotin transport system permease protein